MVMLMTELGLQRLVYLQESEKIHQLILDALAEIGAPFVGEDASGSDEQILQTIPRRAGSVVYLTNNVPYIQKLEYGYSTKSPNGMVRINVARFEGLLNGSS